MADELVAETPKRSRRAPSKESARTAMAAGFADAGTPGVPADTPDTSSVPDVPAEVGRAEPASAGVHGHLTPGVDPGHPATGRVLLREGLAEGDAQAAEPNQEPAHKPLPDEFQAEINANPDPSLRRSLARIWGDTQRSEVSRIRAMALRVEQAKQPPPPPPQPTVGQQAMQLGTQVVAHMLGMTPEEVDAAGTPEALEKLYASRSRAVQEMIAARVAEARAQANAGIRRPPSGFNTNITGEFTNPSLLPDARDSAGSTRLRRGLLSAGFRQQAQLRERGQ